MKVKTWEREERERETDRDTERVSESCLVFLTKRKIAEILLQHC